MPSPDFFNQLGLLVKREFLESTFADQILREASAAEGVPGLVWRQGKVETVSDSRRAKDVEISPELREQVKNRFFALAPELENHFHVKLEGIETPLFVRYSEGDYFHPHRDSSDSPDASKIVRARKIAVVVFLNNETDTIPADSELPMYTGGALTFYGLIKDQGWEERGFALHGEKGLMVAFPAEVFHEVNAVTGGERYSIVCIYY